MWNKQQRNCEITQEISDKKEHVTKISFKYLSQMSNPITLTTKS